MGFFTSLICPTVEILRVEAEKEETVVVWRKKVHDADEGSRALKMTKRPKCPSGHSDNAVLQFLEMQQENA